MIKMNLKDSYEQARLRNDIMVLEMKLEKKRKKLVEHIRMCYEKQKAEERKNET